MNLDTSTHLKITVTNLDSSGGALATPLWISTHDGSFDTFDFFEPASTGIEALAEDGVHGLEGTVPGLVETLINDFDLNTAAVPPQSETISGLFNASSAASNGGKQGVVQANPVGFAPGESSSTLIELGESPEESNRYFSFASMFIPSNDAFIGNENQRSISLFDDDGDFIGADFVVTGNEIWDAGTEVNDEDPNNVPFTLAVVGNGTDENGVIRSHPGLLPPGSGGVLDFPSDSVPVFPNADFTVPDYELLRIKVEAVNIDDSFEYRTIDGSENHQLDLGMAGSQLIRIFESNFEDNLDEPRGGDFDNSSLPNPREVSNIIAQQNESITNFLGASDWLWQWGQFIDHDLGLNEASAEIAPAESDLTPITVPKNDEFFEGVGNIPFIRVPAAPGTGLGTGRPRQTLNQLTSFIDASGVYGSEEERSNFLRVFQHGLLKTSSSNNDEILLPINPEGDDALPNATGGIENSTSFVAGDIRANEQTGLLSVHTLFVREHNRVAEMLHQRLNDNDPKLSRLYDEFLSDRPTNLSSVQEDEFIYQSTRKIIGAEIQKITYEEFLPLLIGREAIGEYRGYNATVIPNLSTEFANAAYRVGHTMLSNNLLNFDQNGLSNTSLAESFFNPDAVSNDGIDSILLGLNLQESQEIDNFIVDEVRNFLFPAGTGGLDLATINIARGREVGLPSYVDVYNQLFPDSVISSFDDLPFREGLAGKDGLFAQAYEDVQDIDLIFGGLAEVPDSHGGLLGATFTHILADQFSRVRDGDRFFYKNELEELNVLYPEFANVSLSNILRDNVDSNFLVFDNAFDVPYENSFFGDDERNILKGSSLNDFIAGGGSGDNIIGRRGDDILIGDGGTDTIKGGRGNDTISGGENIDNLFGNGGE